MSPLIGGNAFATGNVGQGMSLRSFSPISDPTAFGAPLGSAALSAFRRDSVSVGGGLAPLGSVPFVQPFYDPATTVATPSLLRTGSVPSAVARGGLSRPLDLRAPLSAQVGMLPAFTATQLPRYAGEMAPVTPAAPAATASSLFGPQLPGAAPRVQTPLLLEPEAPGPRQGEDRSARVLDLPRDDRAMRNMPVASPAGPGPLATPLDMILTGRPRPGLAVPEADLPAWAGGWRGTEPRPGLIVPPEPSDAMTRAEPPTVPGLGATDPSVLPGRDVFTDMRLALALERDPQARWFEDMQRAAGGATEPAAGQARVDAAAFLNRMLEAPLDTLTGTASSPVNDLMLKAEELMQIGHFHEAADRYESARMLDRMNPLPLIGKGHALLAAGDYSSAALALVQGLELYPELSRFALDLRALMGGGEQIDIRRADLMRRIEARESPELLFLLGYLEYHTGDRTRGLATLDRAAQADRTGSIIGRYPAMLRGQGVMPPPKLPAEPRPERSGLP